jgi:hypothetical protein
VQHYSRIKSATPLSERGIGGNEEKCSSMRLQMLISVASVTSIGMLNLCMQPVLDRSSEPELASTRQSDTPV